MSGCSAAEEPFCAWWYLALVDVALERGPACGAQGEFAEAVAGGVALPACGAHADDAG
jgi:hypothetical protein